MKTENLKQKIAKAERKIEKWKKELEEQEEPLNGWCVLVEDSKQNRKIIVLFNDGVPVHGLGSEGLPFKFYGQTELDYRQATEQEIQERLFDSEQCRQYIGADYDCLTGKKTYKGDFNCFETGKKTYKGDFNCFDFNFQNVWIHFNGCLANQICDSEGNWAEIKEELSQEEKVNEMWEHFKSIKE